MESTSLTPHTSPSPLLCIRTSTYEDFKADRLKPELLKRYYPDSVNKQQLFRFDSHDRVKTQSSSRDLKGSIRFYYDSNNGFSEVSTCKNSEIVEITEEGILNAS
jgi:hypothetical protein